MKHEYKSVPVSSGAGYYQCSCGWRSKVEDDATMFDKNRYSAMKAWEAHVAESENVPMPKASPFRNRIHANVGDHVLATKYGDGHAGDPWVVGVIKEIVTDNGGTYCRCWTHDEPDSARRYRRAVRINLDAEAVYLLTLGTWLERHNPLKSVYSVLGEYRKQKRSEPFLAHDPEAIDD